MVRGTPIGFAIGETSYYPNNFTMSYADACEGAKSISLTRNCKLLGMALDLWDTTWVNQWKKKYAEQYTNEKEKLVWRKKNIPVNPEKEGKTRMIMQLVPTFFKDAAEIAGTMEKLGLTYSLAQHDAIVIKLVRDCLK